LTTAFNKKEINFIFWVGSLWKSTLCAT